MASSSCHPDLCTMMDYHSNRKINRDSNGFSEITKRRSSERELTDEAPFVNMEKKKGTKIHSLS